MSATMTARSRDLTMSYEIGQLQDGVAPDYDDPVTGGECLIRSLSVDTQISVQDNKALCSLDELNVMMSRGGTVSIEYWVPLAGLIFDPLLDLGKYIRVSITETSGAGAAKAYPGIIRRIGHASQVGQFQTQPIEVLLNAA